MGYDLKLYLLVASLAGGMIATSGKAISAEEAAGVYQAVRKVVAKKS